MTPRAANLAREPVVDDELLECGLRMEELMARQKTV